MQARKHPGSLSEVAVRLRVVVFKPLQVNGVEQSLLLRKLEQRQVDENVLVGHLNAEGALRPDALDSAMHVNSAHMLQAPS